MNHSSRSVTATSQATSASDGPDILDSLIPAISRHLDRSPGAALPGHLDAQYQQWQRHETAGHYRPSNAKEQERVAQIRAQMASDWERKSERARKELELAQYVKDRVAPTGLLPEADRIASKLDHCRKTGVIGMRENGTYMVAWDDKCHLSKLCPHEAIQESKRLATRYIPAVDDFLREDPAHTFQYAVFTWPNFGPGELADGVSLIWKRFSKLLRRKVCRAVKGAVVVMEAPLAADGESWNVHLNVLLMVDKRERFDWGQVRESWGANIEFQDARKMVSKTKAVLARRGLDTSRMDRVTVLSHAFRELSKYTVKIAGSDKDSAPEVDPRTGRRRAPAMTEWSPVRWVEWWMAHKGLRRTRSYGRLFRVGEPEQEAADLDTVTWIGKVRFSFGRYFALIDLIPADNSASQSFGKRGISDRSRGSPGGLSPPVGYDPANVDDIG